ncbi:hypothetical protein BDY19DRAFT_981714, partial [Irpex rosettiformis]
MSIPTAPLANLSGFILSLVQTLVYGTFIVLFIITTHVFLKRGTKKPSSIITFSVVVIAFVLSTGSWFVETIALIVNIVVEPSNSLLLVFDALRFNFHALVLLNFLFADGVVVWRTRALCGNDMSQPVLAIPVALLVVTSLTVFVILGLRIYGTILPTHDLPRSGPLRMAINVLQVSNQLFSFLTNVSATSLVARWVWHYRKFIRNNAQRDSSHRQLENTLTLLIESGAIYCVSSILLVLSSVIRTPLNCTLGDIYLPIHAQLAGMYPALIMVLTHRRSGTPPSRVITDCKPRSISQNDIACRTRDSYDSIDVAISPIRFQNMSESGCSRIS